MSGSKNPSVEMGQQMDETTSATVRTPAQGDGLTSGDSLHDKIQAAIEGSELPSHLITLPQVFTPREDRDGRPYVRDTQGLIRWYLGEERLVMTEDLAEMATVNQGTERSTELGDIILS
jgi:hypothetical protein